jgi:pimeloyl-ACP methyl ester carboxylesterase
MKHPIVILHGWGLSAKKFAPLASELRKNHLTVYAPDFPTDEKKPYVLSDYVDFLHSFIEQHNIKQPILLGHSFGGRVALKYQFVYPKNIRALILTGTPGVTPVAKQKIMLVTALAKIGKIIFNYPIVRRWYYYVVGARDYYRAQGAMRDTFKNIVKENLETYMKSVLVPTLLVWGKNDIITPIRVAEKMQSIIPESSLVLIDGDHGVSYKDPKQFGSAIYDFLLSLT